MDEKTTATREAFCIKDTEDFPPWLINFIEIYQSLGVDNLDLLHQVYHQDIFFQDPLHEIQGFSELSKYFRALYTHLTQCDFIITEVLCSQEAAAIYWRMDFTHKKLNHGKQVSIEGHSKIKGREDLVYYHRDFVDLGAMLYEHIPFLGVVIKSIKKRAAQ